MDMPQEMVKTTLGKMVSTALSTWLLNGLQPSFHYFVAYIIQKQKYTLI